MALHQQCTAAAAGPAVPDRPDERMPADEAGIPGEAGIGDDADCAALADPVKRLADLRAKLAERDIALVQMRDGGLLASGVGMRAHFGDLTAAEVWARRARP